MRKFKCIGLIESLETNWSDYFTIGDEYELFKDHGDTLLIYDNVSEFHRLVWRVDADQFEEVKEDTMNKIKIVTEKICELLKGTELEFTVCDTLSTDFNGKLFRPIREAEILSALNVDHDYNCCSNYNFAIESGGGFVLIGNEILDGDDGIHYKYKGISLPFFKLGKTLDHPDNKPVVDFLFNVLNCEG